MKRYIFAFTAYLIILITGTAQTVRVTNNTGSWNTASVWTPSGVPGSSNTVTVNHNLNLNRSLSISGNYTLNADVLNLLPLKYNLTIASTGVLTISKKLYIAGRIIVNSGGKIIIKNGGQLITDSIMYVYTGAQVILEDNSKLDVKQTLSNQGTIDNAGTVTITSNYAGSSGIINKVNNGIMTSVSSMRSSTGTIYGTTNAFCASNCNADAFLCSGVVADPIVSNMSRCGAGSFTITPSGGTGLYRFYTSPNGGVSLTANPRTSYATPILNSTTDYYVTSINANGCESNRVKCTLTINALPNPVIATDTFRCRTGSVQLSATGSDSTYKWFNAAGSLVFTGPVFNTPSISSSTFYRVGAVAKNKCTTPSGSRDTATITIKNSCDIVWTGASSSSWNVVSNWDAGQIPTSVDNVMIPASSINDLNITGTVNVANLTIASLATISSDATTVLNVYGNLISNGTFNNAGELQFSGSNSQVLTGSFSLPKLTVNSTASLTLSNPMTITKKLTLLQGNLISNGNLTVDLNTGNIDGAGVGSITGNITVSKSVGSYKTHYFTCPLDGVTCQDLVDDAEVINPVSNKSRLAELSPTNTWVYISDMNAPLVKGKAYSLYFTTPTTLDFTGTYDHSYVQAFSIDNTVAKDYFIPNPYPCTLDWDASSGWINKNVFNNSISFWDPVNNRYATYSNGVGTNGASNLIPSLQGYWVKSTGGGGTIAVVIGKGALVSDQTHVLWKTVNLNNGYKITLTNLKDSTADETIVRFDPTATSAFDGDLDANKLLNGTNCSNIYTVNNDVKYAINTFDKNGINVLPISVQANEPGMYNIKIQSIGSAKIEDVKVKDLQNNVVYTENSVDVNISSTQSNQRVALIFNNTNSNLSNSELYAYTDSKSFTLVNNSSEVVTNVKLIDALGNNVLDMNCNLTNGQILTQNVQQLKVGVYQLLCSKNGTTQIIKIVVTE